MAQMGDVIRLRNIGDTEFRQQYGGKLYRIPPGSEAIIAFEAMCLWMGHPDAVDIDAKRRYRSDELRRLYVKWGVYENHHLAEQLFPKLRAFDIDGEPIITVIDDPEGRHLTPDVQSRLERDDLREQMAAMQKQMAALQAQLAQADNQVAAQVAAGDTRTDAPSKPPLGQPTDNLPPEIPNPDDETMDDLEGGDDGSGGAMVDRPPRPKAVSSR